MSHTKDEACPALCCTRAEFDAVREKLSAALAKNSDLLNQQIVISCAHDFVAKERDQAQARAALLEAALREISTGHPERTAEQRDDERYHRGFYDALDWAARIARRAIWGPP